jgi:hypothetical protein
MKLCAALDFEHCGLKWREYQHPKRGIVRTLDYQSRNTIYITRGLSERQDKAADEAIKAIKDSKMTAKDYGPSFTIARLYKKTSANGTTYFTGRMGLAKIALLKSNETADDGSEILESRYLRGTGKNRHRQNERIEQRGRV